MTASFAGERVLVAEDKYFISKTLADDLRRAGAEVVGPVATVADAPALIAAEPPDAGGAQRQPARRDRLSGR